MSAGLWLGACAPAVAPVEPAPRASPQPASTVSASASPAEPAACLTPHLAKEGVVGYVGAEKDGALAFCVSHGVSLVDRPVCLRYHPGEAKWSTAELTFVRELIEPKLPSDPASVSTASTAGTMDICSKKDRCAKIQLRPRNQDAFDELFGSLPAIRLSDSRVLLARSDPKDHARVRLEVWDLDQRRAVKSRAVEGGGFDLMPLSPGHALLRLCRPLPHTDTCHAHVLDTNSLEHAPLDVQLTQRESIHLVHPFEGGWVLVDIRGTQIVWLSAAGVVERRVKIAAIGDKDPFIGRLSEPWLAILEKAPNAGTAFLVDLAGGAVKRVDAPRCE